MTTNPLPLVFRQAHTPAESGAPEPGRLVRGTPTTLTTNHYTDSTGQFFSGVWEAGDGAWHVAYAAHEEEFCVLLEGRVTLTATSGECVQLAAGDAFVVPGGFEGTWENHGRVRKLYAIMTLKETPA
jgi:hypothetical protein